MGNGNYLDALHGGEVARDELETILQGHFTWSDTEAIGKVDYRHGASGEIALTLVYNGSDQLEAIVGGPGLTPSDIHTLASRIRECLLVPGEPLVGRSILFASVPTKGYFRYKDAFQLLPVPAEAPKPTVFGYDNHPLRLEFLFHGSADDVIRIQRQSRIGREVELVCVAFVPPVTGSLGNISRGHWIIAPGTSRSQYCEESYSWPQAPIDQREFAQTEDLAPMLRTPAQSFYARRGTSIGQVLDLPDNLEHSLDRYFSLSPESKGRFHRASYWLRHARRVYTVSQSASFTALVSAIEALIEEPPSSGQCPICSKPQGPGQRKLFVDFVDRYASEPEIDGAARKQLYRLRSKLSHGGHLVRNDHAGWGSSLTPSYLGERSNMDAMWRIGQIALTNWLAASR